MLNEETPKTPLVQRAKKDHVRDMALADEAKERGDLLEMHTLCQRALADRKQLAEAFDAIITGWSLVRDGNTSAPQQSDTEAIQAMERVAHEAVAFARETVQAFVAISKK